MKILALKFHPSVWYLLPAFKRVTRYNWERYFVFEWLFFSLDTYIGLDTKQSFENDGIENTDMTCD